MRKPQQLYLTMEKYLNKVLEGEILPELAIRLLCIKVKEILAKEPNMAVLHTPITVAGDVHGQFFDLKELFQVGGPIPHTNYLFLGDYVDRGACSIETITYLLLMKLLYPSRITLLRGNHETRQITQIYGFYTECQRKYGDPFVWQSITEVFNYLPIAALIEGQLFCVHAGLSPSIQTLQDMDKLDRFQEIPHEGPFADIMWSDPDPDNNGFTMSARGAGYMFGKDVVDKFIERNKIKKVLRAHQLCMQGFQILFDGKFVTVWSAPNYCYRFGTVDHMATILVCR